MPCRAPHLCSKYSKTLFRRAICGACDVSGGELLAALQMQCTRGRQTFGELLDGCSETSTERAGLIFTASQENRGKRQQCLVGELSLNITRAACVGVRGFVASLLCMLPALAPTLPRLNDRRKPLHNSSAWCVFCVVCHRVGSICTTGKAFI